MPGRIFSAMFTKDIARKIGVVLLALAVLFATAPIAAGPASASPSPCDCPSMQSMQMGAHDMGSRPSKQHGSPCHDAQNCVCGISCGATVSTLQASMSVVPFLLPQHVVFSRSGGGHGISIRPAIPPPIASV
jgi:hypothetical protein